MAEDEMRLRWGLRGRYIEDISMRYVTGSNESRKCGWKQGWKTQTSLMSQGIYEWKSNMSEGTGVRKGTAPWQSFSCIQRLCSGSGCCGWPWLCSYGRFEEEWTLSLCHHALKSSFQRGIHCNRINLTGRQQDLDCGVVEVCLKKLTWKSRPSPGPGEVAHVCVVAGVAIYLHLPAAVSLVVSCRCLSWNFTSPCLWTNRSLGDRLFHCYPSSNTQSCGKRMQ